MMRIFDEEKEVESQIKYEHLRLSRVFFESHNVLGSRAFIGGQWLCTRSQNFNHFLHETWAATLIEF